MFAHMLIESQRHLDLLEHLDAEQARACIDRWCDSPGRSVRKCDGRFLRALHELALERGYDALTGADVADAHERAYANVAHADIHVDVMQALVLFNNEAVIREAIRIVHAQKPNEGASSAFSKFAGTALATFALQKAASDGVVRTICAKLSSAQLVAVLGRCVGSLALVDRVDHLFPGLNMGQEALRHAIIADDAARTGTDWTQTDWIERVTARVPEAQRVIGKPLLESILVSVPNQPRAVQGLIAIKEPPAAAAAAPDAIPRDMAHLLYVLTCVFGWRYCREPDFFEQLQWSDGTVRNYRRALSSQHFVQGGFRSRVVGKALKAACSLAAKNKIPKSHGVQLPLPARKRLGIVM